VDGGSQMIITMEYKKISLSEVAVLLNVALIGEDQIINELNFCTNKSEYGFILSYSTNINFTRKALENESVKAMFVLEEDYNQLTEAEKEGTSFIVVDYPETKFYTLHHILIDSNVFYNNVSAQSKISETAKIHNTAIVEENVVIGSNTVIGPYSVIRKNSIIGSNVVIGSHVEIGTEGFQVIYNESHEPYLIRHVGGVAIADNVSIGTNSTICNSLFVGHTKIGRNTKIDCHVHISHNCEVGENTIIVDGTILLGTVKIKDNVWVGPNSVLMNKVIVENNSFVGASSFVGNNVNENTKVFGVPARKIQNL